MDTIPLLFSLVLLWPIILFFLFIRLKPSSKGGQLPPSPFAWPIVGNLFQIDPRKPHIALAKLAQTYGPLMSLRLGSRLVVVASSPATAREIYKTHDRELSGRYVPQTACKVPEGRNSTIAISNPANERWRFLRGTVHAALFSPQALESHSQLRVEKAKEMIDFLSSKDGKLVNITEAIYATIVNTWTKLLVSQDFIQSWDKIEEVRTTTRELVEFAMPRLTDLFPIVSCLDFFLKQKIAAHTAAKGSMWSELIGKRRRNQKGIIGSRDYLDVLINKSFNDDQINNLLTELLATAETVAIAVEWAMAELINNQESLATLGKELEKATKGGVLQERELIELPYLQACIKEALRLHPPTPIFLPRSASESCEVMNYKIPKDCLVIVNLYAVATDPTVWEDPLSFKPERFLDKNLDVKGTHYELLPFGGGRRICSGYPLALKEMQLLLATLVHAFHWSLPSRNNPAKVDMSEYFGTTLGLKNPLQLIPKTKNELKIEGY